jgi:hypothetical protein
MTKSFKLIRYSQFEPLFGRMQDFEPHPFGKMERWLFLPNLNREEYEKTENKNLLIPIEHSDIASIKFQSDF